MVSTGRVVAVSVVALGLGFVGGAWFIGSGFGYQLIPVPPVPPPTAPPLVRGPGFVTPLPPVVKAVGLPEPASFSGGSAGLMPMADRADLMPSPGCSWEVEPRPFRVSLPPGSNDRGWLKTDKERAIAGYPSFDLTRGDFRFLLVQSTRKGGTAVDLRPVLLDDAGNRMIPWRGGQGSSRSADGQFSISEFHFAAHSYFAMTSVAYFGIERVPPNAVTLLVETTQKEAKEKGVAILPAPRLGDPYAFDVLDTEGRPIRLRDFRGRAVLVNVWGPEGFSLSPLVMAKKLRETYKEDELAIISVSFHESAEKAKEAVARIGSVGPLVAIPNDLTTRRLWRDGSGIAQLPECFLVDREGILRFRGGNPFEIKHEVDILFGRAIKPFSPMIFPARQGSNKPKAKPSGAAPASRAGGR